MESIHQLQVMPNMKKLKIDTLIMYMNKQLHGCTMKIDSLF